MAVAVQACCFHLRAPDISACCCPSALLCCCVFLFPTTLLACRLMECKVAMTIQYYTRHSKGPILWGTKCASHMFGMGRWIRRLLCACLQIGSKAHGKGFSTFCFDKRVLGLTCWWYSLHRELIEMLSKAATHLIKTQDSVAISQNKDILNGFIQIVAEQQRVEQVLNDHIQQVFQSKYHFFDSSLRRECWLFVCYFLIVMRPGL